MNSLWYIPLAVEFCSCQWSVYLVLVGYSCWSLLAEGLLHWFSSVFALGRIALPLPGGQAKKSARNLLQIAVCGFCLLKTFHAALEDDNENCGLSVFSPWAETLVPHSSVHPQGKALSHSCLPGLHPHSVLTQPVTVCISGMRPRLESPNPADSCVELPHFSSQGRKGGILLVLPFVGPLLGEQSPNCAVYGSPELRAHS